MGARKCDNEPSGPINIRGNSGLAEKRLGKIVFYGVSMQIGPCNEPNSVLPNV